MDTIYNSMERLRVNCRRWVTSRKNFLDPITTHMYICMHSNRAENALDSASN